jgi:hypothetical protein
MTVVVAGRIMRCSEFKAHLRIHRFPGSSNDHRKPNICAVFAFHCD